jgi:Sensors of blue-light using FAD
MAIHRVIYVSRVARHVRFADAETIAREAAVHNAARQLTGMLVYSPSHFIQVLEGDEAAVNDVLARIRKDKRHDQVQVLDARAVSDREFGEWAMVAHRLSASAGFDPKVITTESALETLRGVRAELK